MRRLIVLSIVCAATTSFAVPIRDGANHHLGDDSFVAAFGRAPTARDPEALRMKTHLVYVRAHLAALPPTRRALADRRAELLGYLDDYIANGTTPRNTRVPWRTPVFIDDDGRICAVGYLIERSVGRALAEQIAVAHRHDYLEDIAAAMPAVRAWVEASGFTLDELASIQPGYSASYVESWMTWDLVNHAPPDGPFDDGSVVGVFDKHALHGNWIVKRSREDAAVVGRGKLDHGNGTWRSYYSDGKQLLASGSYRNNTAHGMWTFYHPSGNHAARGAMVDGMRFGKWTFYYDTPARTPLARGRFARSGYAASQWRYYDEHGALLTWDRKDGVTEVTPDEGGVAREEHALSTPMDLGPPDAMDTHALYRFTLRGEQIYVFDSAFANDDVIYDSTGSQLRRTDAGWIAADCGWSAKRRRIAKAGDVAWLHELLSRDSQARRASNDGLDPGDAKGPVCGPAKPIAADRGARIDKMLASSGSARQAAPDFVRQLDPSIDEPEPQPDEPSIDEDADADVHQVLAIQKSSFRGKDWVDLKFDQVYRTMAGRLKYEFLASEPEADGSDPDQNGRGIGR
jgi:hypothetical protein